MYYRELKVGLFIILHRNLIDQFEYLHIDTLKVNVQLYRQLPKGKVLGLKRM